MSNSHFNEAKGHGWSSDGWAITEGVRTITRQWDHKPPSQRKERGHIYLLMEAVFSRHGARKTEEWACEQTGVRHRSYSRGSWLFKVALEMADRPELWFDLFTHSKKNTPLKMPELEQLEWDILMQYQENGHTPPYTDVVSTRPAEHR